MDIGWIDFSREDRQKVMSVLDLLSEEGTLDELGISPIRDGFSALFFPGTSTNQTRAKYFLLVPYILDNLIRNENIDPDRLLERLDKKEREIGEELTLQDAEGVIGSRSIRNRTWVKRAPSSVYWSGIRRYGIFKQGSMSISEYFRAASALKKHKDDLKRLGYSTDEGETMDDEGAGAFSISFWKLPPNYRDGLKNVTIDLTYEEAEFLSNQIILTQPESLLAYILKNQLTQITHLRSFSELGSSAMAASFPEQIRHDYYLAEAFSIFNYGLRIRYNIMISSEKNSAANEEWAQYNKQLSDHANLDINAILHRLKINNPRLKSFLIKAQMHMSKGDISSLDRTIRQREIELKGQSRANISQAGTFPDNKWFGGGKLDYRFDSAKTIIQDIFYGMGCDVKAF